MTTPLAGKTVLVTGATSGIGRATAAGLAGLGANVVLVGRDRQKAEATATAIKEETGNDAVEPLIADLASQASVRKLAAEYSARFPRLDVLINNAGVFLAHRRTTVDGLEYTFAVNHLAPFLLTDLLQDLLISSAPARVVTVSSEAQRMGRIDFDDLQGERDYRGQAAYNQSKLANILFTYELARRLEGTGVTANVLHPGLVRSNFGHEDPTPPIRLVIRFMGPLMLSPERGARTSIYLASSHDVENVTGTYFTKSKPIRSSSRSYDHAVAQRLWQVSADLVGLAQRPGAG